VRGGGIHMRAIVAYASGAIGHGKDEPLQVDLESGLMRDTRQVASPNFDARPPGVEADLIVVHGISLPPGEFGGPWIERLFMNTLPCDLHPYFAEIGELRVSSHLLVARDGNLTQFVKFTERAWHAGQSNYKGRTACNDFSIGVELEGSDSIAYEAAQYTALAAAVAALCDAYPRLSPDRLVGHSEISPGRKTDPGPAFDWERARRCVAAACGPSRRR
jgi:AmpD protein